MEYLNVQSIAIRVIYQSRILSTAKYLAQLNSSQLMHSTVQIVVLNSQERKEKMNRAHTKKESIKRTCSRSWKRKGTATATTTTIFETEQRILSTIEIPMLPLLRHFAAVATTAKPIPMKGHTATTIDEKQSMFSRAFDSLRFGILS